ncbi:MAG: threonine--tRNA ligase [Candidatus Altiarchaeota archaeon]|nr:threonine--tRNA ligase [Candidatus Altiarchaeota archaeon]
MKLLLIHSDFFEFEATRKAIQNPEALTEKNKKARTDNSLVAFMSAEKADEGKEEQVTDRVVSELEDVFKKVGADNIVVYPYAHLSSNLSSPSVADGILSGIYIRLSERGYKVIKAPFGWYKAFKISGKGHPLSELSREIIIGDEKPVKVAKEEASEALKAEEKMRSKWMVLDLDGKLHDVSFDGEKLNGFDFSKHPNLEKFFTYEIAKSREVDRMPPHVELMQRLELVDYEPGSDPGNMRYYPKGRLVKSLLEDLVTEEIKKYGAMEIEAPIMYDFEHPSLKRYLNRFPARQYTIQTPNKKVFLRFAACFGQFLMAHDATISYKNLPMRLYELTKYSFRVEKHGELAGLRRLRSFTMPDCHAFCSDMEQAKKEMLVRFELSKSIHEKIGLKVPDDLEMGMRLVKDFWEENKDFVAGLVKKWGKPVLVEMWDSRFFYFIMKYEWNFIDFLGKASALTTDQLDVENAKNYEITYTDADGSKKYPLIMHLSPTGAIERIIYALLEKAFMSQQGGVQPELPLWLSPTQLRVIPLSEKQFDASRKVLDRIKNERIRVDFDDRDLTLGKKIRDAEKEWVPYIAVIGDKEIESGDLSVRIRGAKDQKTMKPEQLISEINKRIAGMPFKAIPLSVELSRRPKFVG